MTRALALVATVTLLAGCSTDEPPARSAASRAVPSSAAPTESSSTDPVAAYAPPTGAPEPVPAEKVDQTTAGIFVLVWFETLNYAFVSGDADPLRQSVGLGCFSCTNWISQVQTHSDLSQTQTGGFIHVRDLALVGPVQKDFLFRTVLDQDPGVVQAKNGTQKPIPQGRGEVVEIRVGISTSSISGRSMWTVKSLTAPTA